MAAALLIGVAGCAALGPALEPPELGGGYRFSALHASPDHDPDETFVMVTLSGGGTRAAAFSYGALRALQDTRLPSGQTLLDEVDVISSVSGGSFAAAYLGLFGADRFFARFPDDVLHRKLHWGLLARMAAPWNWPWLASPWYSRSDLAADYYGRRIFDDRRFASMPRHRPFILLNATDLGRGAQLAFTQEHFDRLCTRLDDVLVARAVTASSAFPVAFPPITVENHGPSACGFLRPTWVSSALEGDRDANPQRYDLARTWRSYEDPSQRPYIHLSDGGIADNLGLRQFESELLVTQSWGLIDKMLRGKVQRVVIVVVDAKPGGAFAPDHCPRPPGVITVLNEAASAPMGNYSSDTVARVAGMINEFRTAGAGFQARREGCRKLGRDLCATRPASRRTTCEDETRTACQRRLHASPNFSPPTVALHLLHVRFESVPDPVVQAKLKGTGTALQLSRDQVELLVEWGERLVKTHPAYADVLAVPPDR
jgi:NTE family protein